MLLWISRTHHVIITTSKERGIMETILLAGVHGVGKGFFSKETQVCQQQIYIGILEKYLPQKAICIVS